MAIPKDTQEAYDIVASFARTKDGTFDYDSLHASAKVVKTIKVPTLGQDESGKSIVIGYETREEPSRDMSMTMSALQEVVKDLSERVAKLEGK